MSISPINERLTVSFISAVAAGVQLDTETVDLGTHTTASGVDFYTINKKGYVPTLVLSDGAVLNENTAVLLWIADQKPGTIAPLPQTTARYLLINTLNYISSEVHPNIGGLFNPILGPEVRAHITANAHKRLLFLESELTASPFLTGASPTVADFYLFIVLSWTSYVGVDLSAYPTLRAFSARVSELEVVKQATARMATKPSTTLPSPASPHVAHVASASSARAAPTAAAHRIAIDPVDQPTLHCMP